MKQNLDKLTDEQIQARLAPPGAGIPIIAKFILQNFVLPFKIKKTSWTENETKFERANTKLLKEVSQFSISELNTRVLVPPQQGLEDSSRYWSASMTLRHLIIVGSSIETVIIGLSHGQKIEGAADTATVKPESDVDAARIIEAYKNFSDTFMRRIEKSIGDKNSKLTFKHPWFGHMTAKDWMWLMGTHTAIHIKQIRNIRAGLNQI